MVPVDLFMHILHAKPRASRKLEENVRSEATSTDRDSTVYPSYNFVVRDGGYKYDIESILGQGKDILMTTVALSNDRPSIIVISFEPS